MSEELTLSILNHTDYQRANEASPLGLIPGVKQFITFPEGC
jgi:hypothetical protein